jgi:pimeloyl-ACP methyl ester carboxylesterase
MIKIIIIIICLLLLVMIQYSGLFIYLINFGHRLERKTLQQQPVLEDFEGLNEELIEFYSGENRLKGFFYNRKNKDNFKGIILVVHGYGNFHENYLAEIDYFAEHSYLVFAYDGTGCGDSEGKNPKGYPQWVLDLKTAIDMLEELERCRFLPIYLFGHSMGAFAVTAVLNMKPKRVTGVAACSPVNSAKEYAKLLYRLKPGILTNNVLKILAKYERKKFGEIGEYTGLSGINSCKVKVLIAQSKDDKLVPFPCSIANYEKDITNENVRILLFEDLGHFVFKSKLSAQYLNAKHKNYSRFDTYEINTELMEQVLSTFQT